MLKVGRIVPPPSIRSRDPNEKEILRLFKGRALRYNKEGEFIPKHFTPRITTQGGLFTIPPKSYEPFEAEDMDEIIIPNGIRSTLKRMLNQYGVDRFSLFPSLDGLAAQIEWLQPNHE